MQKTKIALALLLLTFAATAVSRSTAQSSNTAAIARARKEPHLRSPTPAEAAVITHYRQVIHEVLDQLHTDDWDESVDFDIEENVLVSNDPYVPLNLDQMMQRTYTVRPGSKLFEHDYASIYTKLQNTHDLNEMQELSKQLKFNRFTVEVHFDALTQGVNPPPGKNADLHLPGAAMAYRIHNYKYDKGESAVLLFGGWTPAMWRGGNEGYRYTFKHAFRDPAIENVVIQFDGAESGIENALQNVNWRHVNDALTP
jgi:hypothetical protein